MKLYSILPSAFPPPPPPLLFLLIILEGGGAGEILWLFQLCPAQPEALVLRSPGCGAGNQISALVGGGMPHDLHGR